MEIFSAGANPSLASAICRYLSFDQGSIEVDNFSDGEIRVKINSNVRGKDSFVIQPLIFPYSDNIMKLLIVIDALRRSSASRITAVVPYYAYSRQEKKTQGREPITAKLIANLIYGSGADRIITIDLHANAIQGFFDIPVDHMSAIRLLADYFLTKGLSRSIIVSPDAGGTARARMFARILNADLAIIDKRRPGPNEADVMNIIGDVSGRSAIMVDDIIDTAGTITKGADALYQAGAASVYAACTHPVLSGPAIKRLSESKIEELVVTDTIPLNGKKLDRVKVISVAPLLGEAVYRVHNNLSVSELFD